MSINTHNLKHVLIVALITVMIIASSTSNVYAGKTLRKGIKGAATGALIGAMIDGSEGAATGAMIGGTVGLIKGANDEKKRKKKKKRRKKRAQQYIQPR